MKLKLIYLIFLCYISLAFACISGKGKADKIIATEDIVELQQKETTAVKADTVTGYAEVADTAADQNAARVIEKFYKEYIKAVLLPGQHLTDSLERKYLTKGLREKAVRIGASTGINTIIRAQDVNEHMLATLKVHHLVDNWYMVEYDWYPDNDREHQEIPLRVTKINGRYMIDYITSYWNGSSYGDSLLLNNLPKQAIDTSSSLSLLKTFYATYVSEYCSMPEGLEPRLETLRKAYLTSNALSQFKIAEDEQELDGVRNWDLLIADFDFDCLWIPSMTYEQLDENTLKMHYVKGPNFERVIRLEVVRSGKDYKINKIHIEKGPW